MESSIKEGSGVLADADGDRSRALFDRVVVVGCG